MPSPNSAPSPAITAARAPGSPRRGRGAAPPAATRPPAAPPPAAPPPGGAPARPAAGEHRGGGRVAHTGRGGEQVGVADHRVSAQPATGRSAGEQATIGETGTARQDQRRPRTAVAVPAAGRDRCGKQVAGPGGEGG